MTPDENHGAFPLITLQRDLLHRLPPTTSSTLNLAQSFARRPPQGGPKFLSGLAICVRNNFGWVGHPLPSHPSPKLAERVGHPNAPFWQRRYYDFNVWSYRKEVEKLRYLHRNPVRRGLVERPEDWEWSSFRHHATGEEGVVEIESRWTARKRERAGQVLRVKVRRA